MLIQKIGVKQSFNHSYHESEQYHFKIRSLHEKNIEQYHTVMNLAVTYLYLYDTDFYKMDNPKHIIVN